LKSKTESQIAYLDLKVAYNDNSFSNNSNSNNSNNLKVTLPRGDNSVLPSFQYKQRIILKQTQQRIRMKQISQWQKIG
jgi:hypothetical protein